MFRWMAHKQICHLRHLLGDYFFTFRSLIPLFTGLTLWSAHASWVQTQTAVLSLCTIMSYNILIHLGSIRSTKTFGHCQEGVQVDLPYVKVFAMRFNLFQGQTSLIVHPENFWNWLKSTQHNPTTKSVSWRNPSPFGRESHLDNCCDSTNHFDKKLQVSLFNDPFQNCSTQFVNSFLPSDFLGHNDFPSTVPSGKLTSVEKLHQLSIRNNDMHGGSSWCRPRQVATCHPRRRLKLQRVPPFQLVQRQKKGWDGWYCCDTFWGFWLEWSKENRSLIGKICLDTFLHSRI